MDSKEPQSKKRKIDQPKEDKTLDDVLVDLLLDLQEKKDSYLNIDNIIEGFKQLIEDNTEGMINRCTVCQIDMGKCNPRQLCGKTYCPEE